MNAYRCWTGAMRSAVYELLRILGGWVNSAWCRVPLAKMFHIGCRLLRSPNRIYSGSLRRRLPHRSISAKLILDEEALWVDREHHLTLLAGVVSLGDLQRPLDALSLRRHLEPSAAAPNLYGDPYHVLLLSYWPGKKCMAGCEASASARWLAFVGHLAIFRAEHRAIFRKGRQGEVLRIHLPRGSVNKAIGKAEAKSPGLPGRTIVLTY